MQPLNRSIQMAKSLQIHIMVWWGSIYIIDVPIWTDTDVLLSKQEASMKFFSIFLLPIYSDKLNNFQYKIKPKQELFHSNVSYINLFLLFLYAYSIFSWYHQRIVVSIETAFLGEQITRCRSIQLMFFLVVLAVHS